MLCTKCGHVSPDSARFCAQCGTALPAPRPTPAPAAAQADKALSGGGSSEPQGRPREPDARAAAAGAGAAAPGQGAHKKEEAPRARKDPPAPDKEPPGPTAAEVQNKQLLWLIIAIAALAVAALANWLYSLYRDSSGIAFSLPPAQIAKHEATPSRSTSPPPQRDAAPAAPIAPSNVPVAAPPVGPETLAAATQASEGSRKKKTRSTAEVKLTKAQMSRLVVHLQTRPTPPSCDGAIATVKKQAHISQLQAREIALRAYPELCAPVAAAAPEPPPMPPRKPSRTLDQVWRERVASECASGFDGLICGEKLRYKLCEGRWATNPPSGQSICRQAE